LYNTLLFERVSIAPCTIPQIGTRRTVSTTNSYDFHMSGRRRRRTIRIGQIGALAGSAVTAMMSGRLGWTNYWGGFVFAPVVLIGALLLIIVVLKERGRPTEKGPRRPG
jgi:peptidoglycan/LPS O-acetylase OafA/YrhL